MSQTHPVALITGAARRIGAVIARTLHAAGYDLALHCRNSRAELDALIGELETQRRNSTLSLQADLDDAERLPALIEATLARFGRLDDVIGRQRIFRVRQGDFDRHRAGVLEPLDPAIPKRIDLGGHSIDPIFLGNTDTLTLEIARQVRFPLRDRRIERGRILGIEAGHRLKQDRRE